MGAMECAGCTMIAFGPAISIFLIVIARDPLRIILFIGGAFFWLLSLLVSSLLWFCIKQAPNSPALEIGLFFSITFQELFRFIYYFLLRKAENGLEKVSATGMHIEGVHSLKNAKDTIAMVCGVGFGFMSGAFALVNVLADANGPGTVGFPGTAGVLNETWVEGHMTYNFFFISALTTSAFVLLHVMWNVLFWHGCRSRKFVMIIVVVASHFLLSGLSLVNREGYYSAALPITYVVLLITMGWTFCVAGGSLANIGTWFRQTRSGLACNRPSDAGSQNVGIIPERASM